MKPLILTLLLATSAFAGPITRHTARTEREWYEREENNVRLSRLRIKVEDLEWQVKRLQRELEGR